MSPPRAPAVEAFLAAFHDARPGLTAQVFGAQPVRFGAADWPSTYEVLAAALPAEGAGTRVLDPACGDGQLLARLAGRGLGAHGLVGVDLSAGELARARERLGPGIALCRAREPAWDDLLGMYDLHLLSDDDRQRVRDEFFAGVAPHLGADGRLDLPRTLRRVTARAR